MSPRFAVGWCALAFLQVRQNRAADGVVAARRATELAPGFPPAWGLLGIGEAGRGQDAAAAAAFGRAVKLTPGYLFA